MPTIIIIYLLSCTLYSEGLDFYLLNTNTVKVLKRKTHFNIIQRYSQLA